MLSILAYVAATIGAAYCMKPLTNLLESSGAAPNETYAKYISLILGLAGLYLLSALTNYLLNRLMLECSAIIMKQLRTELFYPFSDLWRHIVSPDLFISFPPDRSAFCIPPAGERSG